MENREELLNPSVDTSSNALVSIFNEENLLVSYRITSKVKLKKKHVGAEDLPLALLTISTIQIIFHIIPEPNLIKVLRFEPSKCLELWRVLTYMFVHDGWYHLMLNVVIQCIFASFLEKRQGRLRVVSLYLLGGISGVMGASCAHPDLLVGASAGGYSLLLSNVADIVLNYSTITYKLYRIISIAVIVLFDVAYDIVHVYSRKEPLISWEAHFVGGLTGFLLGLVVYRSNEDVEKALKVNRMLYWLGLTVYLALMISFVILIVQIRRCTPTAFIRMTYNYIC